MTMTKNHASLSHDIPITGTKACMPRIGFGVYQIRANHCTAACCSALEAGYTHIDSAQLYRNEAEVGQAVASSGLQRKDVFLTTKIGRACGSVEKSYEAALESVKKMSGGHENGYVDLFLVHIAGREKKQRRELWSALERLFLEGRARSIGVSNFRDYHVEEMKEYATVWPPHVNQIELHPWCQQRELVAYCRANSIIVQAYSPLAQGRRFNDPIVQKIAEKHAKSPSQVLVRYALQKDWVPLPRSEKVERIKENADVCGFDLDKEDMTLLDGLDEGSKGAIFPKNID